MPTVGVSRDSGGGVFLVVAVRPPCRCWRARAGWDRRGLWCRSRTDEVIKCGGRCRVWIGVSLSELASQCLQDRYLFRGSDALGDDQQAEVPRQREQGTQKTGSLGIVVDVGGKRDVYLDGLQGNLRRLSNDE